MTDTMMETIPGMMHAAAIERFGGEITPHALPLPEIGPDDILIHVASAGVGVWDPYEREGGFSRMYGHKTKFPHVLGSEGAGTVVDVGRRVHRFQKGDEVYALSLMNPKGG